MMQRKSSPVGHQAGKTKPGTRHAVLAFDKPPFAQWSGPVSAEHMRGDKTLQDRLGASRLDRLPAGAGEHLLRVFSSMPADGRRPGSATAVPALTPRRVAIAGRSAPDGTRRTPSQWLRRLAWR